MKEEEGRGLSGEYSKPPVSVFYDHFLDKPGNLSLLGSVFTTPYLDSINFTA